MLLTVTTTHRPATDLGYLLVKHPDRVHPFDLPTGTAYVFFPEAGAERCTAAMLVDIEPPRSARRDGFTLGQWVNDRSYAASSLLAAALAKVFRTALRGTSKDRPELAGRPIPLRLHLPVVRCRGGADLASSVFAPLGWEVAAAPIPLDETHPEWGLSRYVDLTLTGQHRLADALNHLYVLLPVLDDAKHYWVAPDEIDKLLRAGEGWLAEHPERALISRRYLAHRRALANEALARLADSEDDASAADTVVLPDPADEDAHLSEHTGARVPLGEQRRSAVVEVLVASGANTVVDLGCGTGALIADLLAQRAGGASRFQRVVGADVSAHVLDRAARRLRLDRLPDRQRDRVALWQTALTYRDDRLPGFDAAVLMEVIEHIDPPRLPAVADAVFGHARPNTVIVTTPNVEYNVRYPNLPAGKLRHTDHRFEWTRAEFADWAGQVASAYGYQSELRPVGEVDPEVGAPTQLAIFRTGEGGT